MSTRRVTALCVAGVVALATFAGCGDDGGSERVRANRPSGTAQGDGGAGKQGADAYVGLTKAAAIDRAEATGTPWRITREDDEQFLVTQDYNPERVNFEIDDGKVTTATYG